MFPHLSTLSEHFAIEYFTTNRYAGAWNVSQRSMTSYILSWVGSTRIFRNGHRQLTEWRMFRRLSVRGWVGGWCEIFLTYSFSLLIARTTMSIAENHHLEFTSSQIALTSRSLKRPSGGVVSVSEIPRTWSVLETYIWSFSSWCVCKLPLVIHVQYY